MNVKLISYSQPSKEMLEDGLDNVQELIAFCARVSNPSNQYNKETSEKLISYLIKHAHWSPLEMTSACLEITTTRDIARQILRHRSFSFQEFCLSGDTEIYFAVPKKLEKGHYKPTTKIKLKDLYEKWHLGAKPIMRRNGELFRFPMKDRIEKMYIKCFDENTGKLTTAHIKEIYDTGIKPVFEITLKDGKKIKTTKEHKFLTPEGFDTLENIVGLQIINKRVIMTKQTPKIGTNGIPFYQDKQWLTERKQESLFLGGGLRWISENYDVNYNTLRKWIRNHGLQYTKKETAQTVDVWNKGKFGYKNKPHSYDTRKKMSVSAKARGVDHNWYRGGNSHRRENLNGTDAKFFRDSKNHTCERCGKYGGILDIHHIVPVSVDASLIHEQTNWELLCRACHIEHHKGEDMTGWQSLGTKSKKNGAYTVKWTSIESIEYIGEEQTYDIEIDHYSHNYIANGIITHNSQRYADPTKDLSFVFREARLQDPKNRQNSVELEDNLHGENLKELWKHYQERVLKASTEAYKWAVDNGIAKEQARAVLPEGMTVSRMYVNGTLRSWIHYCDLRMENGTQKEHMEIARECANVISEIFPMAQQFVEQQ